jgi:hypothetical protein
MRSKIFFMSPWLTATSAIWKMIFRACRMVAVGAASEGGPYRDEEVYIAEPLAFSPVGEW